MMSLFSLDELMDTARGYQKACCDIVHEARQGMLEGLGLEVKAPPSTTRITA
jgi:hypothetical protein